MCEARLATLQHIEDPLAGILAIVIGGSVHGAHRQVIAAHACVGGWLARFLGVAQRKLAPTLIDSQNGALVVDHGNFGRH